MRLFDQERKEKMLSGLNKRNGRLLVLSKLEKRAFLGEPDKIGSAE
jgi:hypothetical protein